MNFRAGVTALSAVLLSGLLLFLLFPTGTSGTLGNLKYPGQSAGRMVERHLEFYEGYTTTPGWERALHEFLFGARGDIEHDAIGVYREVLHHLDAHPEDATPWTVLNTRARLLVTLAETGRRDELARELAAFDANPEEEAIADAIVFAYGDPADEESLRDFVAGTDLMPIGWSSDNLRQRIASRIGNKRAEYVYGQRLQARGERWRERVLILSGVVASVVLLGTLLLLMRRRLLAGPGPWRAGALNDPWSLGEGGSVFVRAALLGLCITGVLGLIADQYFKPGILALWSTLFASLPMMWLIHRHLLRPRGLSFGTAFGLRLRGVGVVQFAQITLVLLAIEWTGTLLIAWAGWKFGMDSHWSQGLYERMIFGPWNTTVLSAFNMVVWTAVFEEIGFRGLVYVALRSRLRPVPAAVLSAALFSALHLYSLVGFLSVFWSGLVLAFAFERFRSLLPGMVVHAAGNMLTLSTVLLFYR